MLEYFFPTQVDLNPFQRLLAGGGAGVSALVLTYPLEFVRIRLTLQKTKIYNGAKDCFVKVYKNEGYFALYRGMFPSILGVLPYVGVDFAVYETLKQYSPRNPDGSVNNLVTLANGGFAGFLAQTMAYPMDLVRRRLQVQGFDSGITNSEIRYNGIFHAFSLIYKNEGFFGFYKGILPNFIKVVPAISVSFWVYEKMKLVLKITPRSKNNKK